MYVLYSVYYRNKAPFGANLKKRLTQEGFQFNGRPGKPLTRNGL